MKPPQKPVINSTFSPGVITKQAEEQADKEAADDVHHECSHWEGSMEHPRTPFADKVAATGTHKTVCTGD